MSMTHLTPEEAAAVYWFRTTAEFDSDRAKVLMDCGLPLSASDHIRIAERSTLAADAIEERAALAGQVVVLREALEVVMDAFTSSSPDGGPPEVTIHHEPYLKGEAALALSLPQAAAQVQEWKEKAELLEWWFDEANEDAREKVRFERWTSETPWPAQEWIARVRAAKEASDDK